MRKEAKSRDLAWLRLAVAQGISAPVVYAFAAIVGGFLYPGYSHVSQAVSELSAAGAPNQFWLATAFAVMEILTIVFGLGFYLAIRSASRTLSASALVLVAIGILGLGFARFPMDSIGTPMTLDGQMHIVIVSVSALLAVAAVALSGIGWRRLPDGATMARFTFAMLAMMLASGVASAVVAGFGLPGIGVWQRVNVGAFSLWQVGTVIHLLRRI